MQAQIEVGPGQERGLPAEGYLDVQDSVVTVWRARWLLLAAVAIGGLAGVVQASLRPRLYQASAVLREVSLSAADDARVSKASLALLRDPKLASAAVRDLRLPIAADGVFGRAVVAEELPGAVPTLAIRARWTDPATAVKLANAYAEAAVALSRTATQERAGAASVDRDLELARNRVLEAQRQLVLLTRTPPPAQRPGVDSPAGARERPWTYSEHDAAIDSLSLEISLAEEAYVDLALARLRREQQMSHLEIVERAAEPARPLSRRRLFGGLVGAAVAALLSLTAVFAYLIVEPATRGRSARAD